MAARADQRNKLERLCRTISRPALSQARLSLTPGAHLRYELNTPYRDGTTHVLFEPLDFLARLAALAAQTAGEPHPLPRRVRTQQRAPRAGDQGPPGQGRNRPGSGPHTPQLPRRAARGHDLGATPQARVRHRPPDLPGLARGALRIIACIEDPVVIDKILAHLDAKAGAAQAARPPPCRGPPEGRSSGELAGAVQLA